MPGRLPLGRLLLGMGLALSCCAGCRLLHPGAPGASLSQRILPPIDYTPADLIPTELPHSARSQREQGNVHLARAAGSPETEPLPAPRRIESGAQEVDCRGPLTLERAVALALDANPHLEVMQERIAQARAGKQVAFADFLPQATGSYRLIAASNSPFALPTLPTDVGNIAYGGTADRFGITELNMQWTLWDFGRTLGRYGQADAAFDIARLQFQRARQTVAFNVTAAYLAVLQARSSHVIAEEAVRRAESFLRDARNFQRRGVAVKNDVLRGELLLADMHL